MNAAERAAAITAHVDTLEALAQEVAAGPHWPGRPRPVSYFVGHYVKRLLAHLVTADGTHFLEELHLLQAYFHDDVDLREEEAWIRDTVEAFPDATWTVPPFFLAARAHDRATGTTFAPRMFFEIEAICRLAIEADGTTALPELELTLTVLQSLKGILSK